MLTHRSPRGFEIVFRSVPRLREIVRASLHLPLPPVLSPKPPPPDPAKREREERQAIEQVLEQLRKAADQLAKRYDTMLDEMRQAAIELAVAVAGRVVFDKLQAGEFPVEEMARQARARLPAAPSVTVYLHPDDLALLRRRLADKPLLPARETQLRIEADPSLRRGGCRAEAGEIHVLADLADQLTGLRQHLLWSASHAQSGPGPAAS
ncbi:MAG TPA: FliH/SctL family protein [Gemmataceae bacterium]|nr:FliH/SctL family protein [Gemmataceae bacterium]